MRIKLRAARRSDYSLTDAPRAAQPRKHGAKQRATEKDNPKEDPAMEYSDELPGEPDKPVDLR